jgi:ABC-2 type transport system ATP-binding protein
MEVIKISNVTKSYGKIKALDNLCLTIEQGEIYGFIGPNGAGKSTSIRLLLNFLQADSGSISVLGLDPQKDEVVIKQKTGYVSADTFMYPDMKVKELFHFTEGFHNINAAAKIKSLTDALDIDVNKRFEQLSFGNRKKVSIACALLHSPELIILDEPSNGLDPVIRTNLYELLREEQKNGSTIFFSSHVLSEVQKFCTRIGLLKEGVLIKENTSEDFVNVGYRQIRIESNNLPDLSKLKGVAGIEKKQNSIQFMYSGNLNDLIRMLGNVDLASIHIEEPELDQIFMHYFTDERKQNDI